MQGKFTDMNQANANKIAAMMGAKEDVEETLLEVSEGFCSQI